MRCLIAELAFFSFFNISFIRYSFLWSRPRVLRFEETSTNYPSVARTPGKLIELDLARARD